MLDTLNDLAGALALVAVVLAGIALLLVVMGQRRRPAEAGAEYQGIPDDPSLERYIAAQAQRLESLSVAVAGLREQAAASDGGVRHAIQHVGLVRFNPFDDTGSNQSFALALLDGEADGIVLSSLHSRAATRVYVKAILGGRSEATLSAEELAALRDAGLNI